MKISKLKVERGWKFCIDGKIVSRTVIDEFCKKFLKPEGITAMWNRIFDYGACVIEFDINFDSDENKILAEKNLNLEWEREKNAALEKKLMQYRIKAAKYDAMVSAMKNQAV